MNNVVIAVAFIIAASWIWGALGMMERNYKLQKVLDLKKRELRLVDLQTQNLQFQKRYYQTDEYKELAVRQSLGLGRPGESVLVLPANSEEAKRVDAQAAAQTAALPATSNLEQWVNFLFGGYSHSLAQDS